jgi:DNA gyrase subunit B
MTITQREVVEHFTARATGYDRSSSWCTDEVLCARIVEAARVGPRDHVLDVACGTGLVSKHFKSRVARVVGVDITSDMFEQARAHVDELIPAPSEALPFPDDTFDAVVCRQGIQFMDLPEAIHSMVRVLKPGGRIVLVNLTASGPEDRDEYFEILRLRNPVRRHFFLPEDVAALLRDAGCRNVSLEKYVSVEDVDVWSDNGAIDEERREAIRRVYRGASQAFLDLHGVQESDGRFTDRMLFVLAAGEKP